MLDVRNLAIGLRERYGYTHSNDPPPSQKNEEQPQEVRAEGETAADDTARKGEDEGENEQPEAQPKTTDEFPESTSHFITPLDLSSGKAVISLADMVQATNALKTNIDVDVALPDAQWMSALPSRSPSPSKRQRLISPGGDSESGNIGQVAQAISGLQREVLLLRNELNFELWVQRENIKHIGRLYQDRILMRSAEAERQGLVRAFS